MSNTSDTIQEDTGVPTVEVTIGELTRLIQLLTACQMELHRNRPVPANDSADKARQKIADLRERAMEAADE